MCFSLFHSRVCKCVSRCFTHGSIIVFLIVSITGLYSMSAFRVVFYYYYEFILTIIIVSEIILVSYFYINIVMLFFVLSNFFLVTLGYTVGFLEALLIYLSIYYYRLTFVLCLIYLYILYIYVY